MSHSSKFASMFGAIAFSLFVIALSAAPSAFAQTAGGATPPPPKGGQDFDAKEHTVVSGKLEMKKPGDKKDDGDDDNSIATIFSAPETYKVTASSDKIIEDLKSRDGKKVSVEGKLDPKTNTIAVSKILEGVQPPSQLRNPRGM